jgi:hypothetical protein
MFKGLVLMLVWTMIHGPNGTISVSQTASQVPGSTCEAFKKRVADGFNPGVLVVNDYQRFERIKTTVECLPLE